MTLVARSIIVFGCVAILVGLSSVAWAEELSVPEGASRDELEQLIRSRAEELERVNRELEAAQQNLKSTKSQRTSLQQQVNSLTSNIRQLELNIKADQIASQRLNFEIDSINYDIHDIELSMRDKREAIGRVLREMQQQENASPLLAFLRSPSLAAGVFEAHSLTRLRTQLGADIENLAALQKQLGQKIEVVSDKKQEIEFRRKTLAARKSLIEDQKSERTVVLAQTKSNEAVYEQQLAELRKQQDAIQDEIAKFENQLRSNFDTGVLPSAMAGLWEWPVKLTRDGGQGRLTQHFGERSSLYRGKPHNGTDLGAPVGTPVFAVDEGVVMASDNNDRSTRSKYQYGRYILIKHPNNLASLYAHLSKQVVGKGETVSRGQLIGYVGNTGYSTGPHLHLGAYWAPSIQLKGISPAAGLVPIGVTVSPEDYLPKH